MLVCPKAHKGQLDELTHDELLDLQLPVRHMIGNPRGTDDAGRLQRRAEPRPGGGARACRVICTGTSSRAGTATPTSCRSLADTKVISQSLEALYDLLREESNGRKTTCVHHHQPPDTTCGPTHARTAGSPRMRCGRRQAAAGGTRADHPFRSLYQRDRERIVHCTAFRRMTGKTQVLVASVNDHHRTRLTHTLEVTQIARTVARRLRLNEDLTEAIALAHDIGHPPFGHAGEAALDECLKDHSAGSITTFSACAASMNWKNATRSFPGLNLSFEVREAFVHTAGGSTPPECAEFHGAGSPLLEAQVVDVVDSASPTTRTTPTTPSASGSSRSTN